MQGGSVALWRRRGEIQRCGHPICDDELLFCLWFEFRRRAVGYCAWQLWRQVLLVRRVQSIGKSNDVCLCDVVRPC